MRAFLTGETHSDAHVSGRTQQKKDAPVQQQFVYGGETITIFQGTHAAEDKRWWHTRARGRLSLARLV